MVKAEVHTIFDEKNTQTAQHIVWCPNTKKAVIVDAVLDFDPAAVRTSTANVDALVAFVKEKGLDVIMLLETHAHADHISGAPAFRKALGKADLPIGIGAHITEVQGIFKGVFELGEDFAPDGTQFDRLFADGDTLEVGELVLTVMHTPGHTPACVTYYAAGDLALVGDTLFMPDMGTARCDFPGGSADTLWESMQKILALPDDTRIFCCHDYAPGGRGYAWETTVGAEKSGNKHVKVGTVAEEFKAWRKERDAQLSVPKLIIPSIQCNIRAGELPAPDKEGGKAFLKYPLNTL